MIASLNGINVFNAFGSCDHKLFTLERLINRINRTMREWGSFGILIFDEGEERQYTKLVRRMGVFNMIRSRYQGWEDGNEYKNTPIEYVVEDPSFRKSRQSYLIQLADFCGYALVQKERPTTNPKRARYQLDRLFQRLKPKCVIDAYPADEFGIIRYP